MFELEHTFYMKYVSMSQVKNLYSTFSLSVSFFSFLWAVTLGLRDLKPDAGLLGCVEDVGGSLVTMLRSSSYFTYLLKLQI